MIVRNQLEVTSLVARPAFLQTAITFPPFSFRSNSMFDPRVQGGDAIVLMILSSLYYTTQVRSAILSIID
jgi:hypothetical protein